MAEDRTKKILGATFRKFREQQELSRYALAQRSGMDSSWLRRFENGQSGIRVETLLILAKALGVPASEIIAAMEKALESFLEKN
jgi:transcriptional regulator with XRE-family HTH domain